MKPGTLFRFHSNLTRHTIRGALTIPNGIGWSPDHKTQYFVHSTEKRIFAYDYDSSTGSLSNERVFFEYQGEGDPDGFTIDEHGNIWQAVYGDSKVLKIENREGKGVVVGEILYPTKAITCPVFVGTELWVTTAGGEEGGKFAGAVFRVDVGVKGLKNFSFILEREV